MNVEALLDTNVLLYALSKASEDALKRERARQLMATVNFGISLQVLQEFYHAVRRKARLGITEELADVLINALLERPLVISDLETFRRARTLTQEAGISYWDAAVLATAAQAGAPVLYSEDLNSGQVYAGVRVINPFLHTV
jgi:predicted nucleic acid-binding protein